MPKVEAPIALIHDGAEMVLRVYLDRANAEIERLEVAADSDRARFVRDTAARLFANVENRCAAIGMSDDEWNAALPKALTACVAHAESLAARVFPAPQEPGR